MFFKPSLASGSCLFLKGFLLTELVIANEVVNQIHSLLSYLING